MKKLFSGLKSKVKALVTMAVFILTMAAMSVVTFAAGDDSVIASAMETGLEKMLTDLFALVAVVLPVGLTIFAAFFGVKKVISMLRSTSGA